MIFLFYSHYSLRFLNLFRQNTVYTVNDKYYQCFMSLTRNIDIEIVLSLNKSFNEHPQKMFY
jgi:hypothetical protein